MIAAGGYWRPLAAVARLLEELGELSELLETSPGATSSAASWPTCGSSRPRWPTSSWREVRGAGDAARRPPADLGMLLAAAGPIARVVNHYDGPKVPRAGEPMPTLHGARSPASTRRCGPSPRRARSTSAAAVRAKIEHIHARGDIERFGREGFDPSTAPRCSTRPRPGRRCRRAPVGCAGRAPATRASGGRVSSRPLAREPLDDVREGGARRAAIEALR